MFDKDFFPTPLPVAQKLIADLKLGFVTILEPSAGKGDLLDVIVDRLMSLRHVRREQALRQVFAIERNPELQAILRAKGYTLLDSDFLTFEPEQYFDVIVTNPPFSVGASHLLKALDIANGAEIRSLYSTHTLNQNRTREQQLLSERLASLGAEITDLGSCFRTAERTTNVPVSLIRVPAQPRARTFHFQGSKQGEASFTLQDMANNQLAPTDIFQSLVHRYNKLKQIGHQIHQLMVEADFYAEGLLSQKKPREILIEALKTPAYERSFEQFVSNLRSQAWKSLYGQTNIAGLVTSKVRQELDAAQDQHGAMAFTEMNLQDLMGHLFLSLGSIRRDCILHAFDVLTRYHADNRIHIEGWKHNDAWMIKPKIIIPWGAEAKFSGEPKVRWGRQSELLDIEKALCFVTGQQFQDIQDHSIIKMTETQTLNWGEWYQSAFFKFKLFKKGTIHLQFNDKAVCDAFNLEACQGKNWIPADWGKSSVA